MVPRPTTPLPQCRRRALLVFALPGAAWLAGCASDAPSAPRPSPDSLLTPWRSLIGGFQAPPAPGVGMLPRPGIGPFVRLVAPAALALRGAELLVADLAGSRLWRVDTMTQAMTAIAGAPVGPGTALLLGPDLSAWVLDPPTRQVLRFGRDGRLLQSFRAAPGAAPSAIALADGGNTLLQADGALSQWSEQRSVGALTVALRPEGDARALHVDAIALGARGVYVLDRLAAAVYRVQRDGRIVQTLGAGELQQPQSLAVDRWERIFVVESTLRTLRVLRSGAPSSVLSAEQLGVQQIGGIAVDEGFLAVSDRLAGKVVMHQLGGGVS
jgi:hypothetical protein